jgi:hypothetical protein
VRAWLPVVVALCCLVSCGDEQPELVIAADRASFTFESTPSGAAVATASFVTRNRSVKVGFVRTCEGEPSVSLERFGPNGWEPYVADYCSALVQPPLEVRLGDRVAGASHIRLGGRYRLRLDYADDADLTMRYTTVSVPFDVL